MYKDRNLPQAESTAASLGSRNIDHGLHRDKDWDDNVDTLVLKNLVIWGSAAVSCGTIYLLFKLFI
ncbi:hypothetical protein [Roseobacter sp. CCS2]|uniref:hypothetical protein n=1 Tax=Roseobacter sp. CCS2 TaxID=391593 RepID=UPI00056B7938|nr:hypothetical protein [Roseobacter sp. CCS2]